MRNNEKAEFLEQLIEAVREIPIEEIIGKEVDLFPRGQHHLGLCPFHPDNHIGSFIVTPEKQMYKCFACGKGGNGIAFVMEYYEMSFLDACYKLALEYGIRTKKEIEYISRKKYDDSMVKKFEREALSEEKETQVPYKAPLDVRHNVYHAMACVCGLSDTHKNHLLKERGLQESELADFFTFPTRKMNLVDKVLKQVEATLYGWARKQYPEAKKESVDKLVQSKMARIMTELPYVPGFYTNTDGKIDFVSYKGIGFLIRDEYGHIHGIQIRKDVVKEKESRYIWFSSAFASRIEGCFGGAPSGSPGGFLKAKKTIKNPILFITEGRFKAEAIAKTGNDAVYVSGVSTWRSVMPIVKSVLEQENEKKVCLAFDADTLGNTAVYDQLKALGTTLLKEHYTVFVMLWSESVGKGFDDLLLHVGEENLKKHVKMKAFNAFMSEYQLSLEEALKQMCVRNVREVATDKVEEFCSILQLCNESRFFTKQKAV